MFQNIQKWLLLPRKVEMAKKDRKQPRFHELKVQFPEGVIPSEIVVTSEMNVVFKDESGAITPLTARLKYAYERTKKPLPKVLEQAPLDPKLLCADATAALGRYDYILAIDTNTKEINGEKISVGCIVRCKLDLSKLPEFHASVWPDACVEVRNTRVPPEQLFWEVVLRGVEGNASYNEMGSVGVIVDSELGRLEDINTRSKPIRSDFFLPQKCQLVYASADKGTEWLGYHLIKLCDKVASFVLQKLETNPPSEQSLQKSTSGLHDQFRYWNIRTTKKGRDTFMEVSPRVQ